MSQFIRLNIEISQPQLGEPFLGTCEEMGIALQGKDSEEVERALLKSIYVFLYTLEQHGEREAFLERNGIAVVESEEANLPHPVVQKTLALAIGA